eukprot:TCONS_00036575-protein
MNGMNVIQVQRLSADVNFVRGKFQHLKVGPVQNIMHNHQQLTICILKELCKEHFLEAGEEKQCILMTSPEGPTIWADQHLQFLRNRRVFCRFADLENDDENEL